MADLTAAQIFLLVSVKFYFLFLCEDRMINLLIFNLSANE